MHLRDHRQGYIMRVSLACRLCCVYAPLDHRLSIGSPHYSTTATSSERLKGPKSCFRIFRSVSVRVITRFGGFPHRIRRPSSWKEMHPATP
jgi:uncharacterized protein (DUF924 family)